MADKKKVMLPYRTTGEDIASLLEARARGRSMSQVSAMMDSAGTFQGTSLAAASLGFLDGNGQLTAQGKEVALADRSKQEELVLRAVLGYEPYELLIESIFIKEDPGTTDLDWIERWWATNGYGSSQTNLSEGSTALAKIIAFTGTGVYKQGRHGYSTRIEWKPGAKSTIDSVIRGGRVVETADEASQATSVPSQRATTEDVPISESFEDELESDVIRLDLPLASGIARIVLPKEMTASDKDRLMALIDLLITPTEHTSKIQEP